MRADGPVGYVERALDIMERHSIRREAVNWDELRSECIAEAQTASTLTDAYRIIRKALRSLDDGHSHFVEPDAAEEWRIGKVSTGGNCNAKLQGDVINSKFGYLQVPSFASGDQRQMTRFTDELHSLIARIDGPNLSGWIVDLRENRGGNMWPMLAGLGPVLGDGRLGSFLSPNGWRDNWWYFRGEAGVGGSVCASASRDAYRLQSPDPRVAVLTGSNTASSGEAVAVAFRGRENTKSFGEPTRGKATGNAVYTLSDGALLVLTTSYFTDRRGQVYDGPIQPDEWIDAGASPCGTSEDPVLAAAMQWLRLL